MHKSVILKHIELEYKIQRCSLGKYGNFPFEILAGSYGLQSQVPEYTNLSSI